MPVTVIVGVQWGDEGKGKIVDMLSGDMDFIARYQGGANAGHTVVVKGEKHILHLVPSGILRKGKTCVIGSGVVLDPSAFLEETGGLEERGYKTVGSLFISNRAHLIMPYHKLMDTASEKRLEGGEKIGTTGRGIGPAYADKASRVGLRVGDLFRPDHFRSRLERAVERKNILFKQLYGEAVADVDQVYEQYMKYAARLKDYAADCGGLLRKAIADGKNILAEGAQGTMLDIDQGTYPFVTSSSASAGGACVGLGVPPSSIAKVVGIMKAYTTRVGEGPFPTELDGDEAENLRKQGAEFGATTGRPRRCGWLDAVVGRYSVQVNGIDAIALTKLDVLDRMDEIKVCVAYRDGEERYTEIPEQTEILARVQPVYETMPGWHSSTSGIDAFDSLPDNAKRYIDRVEELVLAPVSIVSTGVGRDATIVR